MSEAQSTTLLIGGMTCGSCVRHVDEALRALEGVTDVQVTLADGKAVVAHDGALASAKALIEAINNAGYEAQLK